MDAIIKLSCSSDLSVLYMCTGRRDRLEMSPIQLAIVILFK